MSQRQRGQALVKVVFGMEGQEAGTVVVMSLHGLRERKRAHSLGISLETTGWGQPTAAQEGTIGGCALSGVDSYYR